MLNDINELAITQFIEYRKSIKKSVKPASLEALRFKLSRMGDKNQQQACVDRSIANGWQGIFPPDNSTVKRAFQPTAKTTKQVEFDESQFAAQNERAATHWESSTDHLAKLLLCEALLGRYTVTGQTGDTEKMNSLREITAKHIRAAEPSEVLGNPHLNGLVRLLFNERGIRRLQASCA